MSSVLICSVSVSDFIIVWLDVVMRVTIINDLRIFTMCEMISGSSSSFDRHSVSNVVSNVISQTIYINFFCSVESPNHVDFCSIYFSPSKRFIKTGSLEGKMLKRLEF